MSLPGYKLIRSDHPSNTKRGGICIYHKKGLPIKVLNIQYLQECLVCEITFNAKKVFIVSLYRSPSQSSDEFSKFIVNLEKTINLIQSSGITLLLGDFNAKLKRWYSEHSDTNEGLEIESVVNLFGFTQLISEPTHILPSSSTCIDLIFTNHPNMIIDSGAHPSLHSSCHHQVTYAKISLKVYFPPPYQRRV